jgi:hypothetical protein
MLYVRSNWLLRRRFCCSQIGPFIAMQRQMLRLSRPRIALLSNGETLLFPGRSFYQNRVTNATPVSAEDSTAIQ